MNDQRSRGSAYQQAGVDNVSGQRAKDRIGARIRETFTDGVVGDYGHFGGMFRSPGTGNVLVSSADSVGTKVLLAVHAGKHAGIGVDLVNHSINDILCTGAQPLFFLDYFATSSFDEATLAEVVDGMSRACREAGCALIGGETAQLPGIYREDTYDLAGFIVGSVPEDQLIDGSEIAPGNVVLGISSEGLHTNGYSLARAVFGLDGDDSSTIRERMNQHIPELGETLGDSLLRPHRCYLSSVAPVLDSGQITGMAHITGGGIAGNLERIIPAGYTAVIDTDSWTAPALFRLIQREGGVSNEEMFSVFNMGVGFILIVHAELGEKLAREEDISVIGRITERGPEDGRVRLLGVER